MSEKSCPNLIVCLDVKVLIHYILVVIYYIKRVKITLTDSTILTYSTMKTGLHLLEEVQEVVTHFIYFISNLINSIYIHAYSSHLSSINPPLY